jgi:hypothetical protein
MIYGGIETRGLEEHLYASNKKVTRLSYPSAKDYVYITYRSWSKWAPGRWVLFVCCSPACGIHDKEDDETKAVLRLAQSLGYGGLGILYLFNQKTEEDFSSFSSGHIKQGADYWIKEARRQFKTRIAAWGDRGMTIDRDIEVWSKLRPMSCLGRTPSGNPIDPQTKTSRLLPIPFYISPMKRATICSQKREKNTRQENYG